MTLIATRASISNITWRVLQLCYLNAVFIAHLFAAKIKTYMALTSFILFCIQSFLLPHKGKIFVRGSDGIATTPEAAGKWP